MKPKTSIELGEISRKYSHLIKDEGLSPAEELMVADMIQECLFAVHLSGALETLKKVP